jgi:hypothetical protein
MASRLDLHELLCSVLGTRNVYFQPPESIKMQYPCIVYKRSSINTRFADDELYMRKKRYTVTVIDKNPDSEIPDKVASIPMCTFDRHFTSDNLNHDVFLIYY